jgi:3-oxoacyl-[acyl-carrier protein] reductase
VLVNNATGYGFADDEASWAASVAVDLLALVRASREAPPFMVQGGDGSIINTVCGSGLNRSVHAPA